MRKEKRWIINIWNLLWYDTLGLHKGQGLILVFKKKDMDQSRSMINLNYLVKDMNF